ncbi:geranylgeranylglycerol-phosphate geranylgeranyltransferase [Winogradskyella immobilis]|uniref:Geranylgeranylglycerol-phosphate geranylgeranyltransferase n=1 Tax=Winogradskyella immobilis TaxID=2816852 RepID=A0ABS8ENX5_9FLAO|nr:geranylgeranylglycerol-phosphate geranylgeranyltransferase [Winogradskyella immobilis]MCC1484265.1 geranylgeranylglycerol-phosphate geranylgeranyltransferase [Winogradskyella immobilis]MCG0016357.1 geranylgeranylglycerol-phosphate geranylgeranyltransferase [Winogradskyella immobilis]
MHFLNLIRWKNLVLIALVQCLIKYALLNPFQDSYGVQTTLQPLGFLVLVLATLCIAAAGYIINDIQDVEADKINKPDRVIIDTYISEKLATNLFIVLNVIGVVLGYILSYSVEQTNFFAIFIIVSGLLYIYSTYLKSILLVGNIVISLIVALSIIIVGVFDILPVISDNNRDIQVFFFKLILDYAVFAFMINLLRELIKSIEDVDGDYKIGVQSLPIILGRERANKIVFILSVIPIICIIFYVVNNLFKQLVAVGYFLIFVIAPLIYVTIKLYTAESKKDYHFTSSILKFVMLTGMLSILLYQFILLN